MFIAIKYETKSPNDSKEVLGIFQSVKAFEDNVTGVCKHKHFNEYFDSEFTYILKCAEVYEEVPNKLLSYSFNKGTFNLLLDDEPVTFSELKSKKYCLKYNEFKNLLKRVQNEMKAKVLHETVGNTIIINLRKIYTFSF